jgi:hypothetical protein
MTPTEQKENIYKKFDLLSLKYHNLSLLMHELSKSIKYTCWNMSLKETKQYIKSLNLDIDKLMRLTKAFSDVTLEDVKGGINKNGEKSL